MSEKAVSIGNYVVATGIDTYLGVEPYATGSEEVDKLLKGGLRDWVEAAFTVESDIDKLGDIMVEAIEKKREALGI
jgi:carbon-monoxide dehydrogenase catalytic subunit